MPIQTLPAKSVNASTWTQLGTGSYPAVPGTLVLSAGTTFFVGPTNADSSAWAYCPTTVHPIQVYVPDISAVWVKGDATTSIYLSYYPATETAVPMR